MSGTPVDLKKPSNKLAATVLVVAAALVPCALAAEPPPDRLAEALKRWDAAVGRAPDHLLVRAAVDEDGIPGTLEEAVDGGAVRRMTRLHDRSREEVFKDGRAWLKDWNGKVMELAGRDRRDALAVAAIETLLFRGPAGTPELARTATLSDASESGKGTSLRFAPADGAPFDVTLDPGTGLPARVTRTVYGETVTLEPSDWKEAGGVKTPRGIRERSGESEDGGTTISVKEIVAGGRGSSRIAPPKDGPRDYRFTSGSSATGIPFNFENDHLMVLGSVNGSKPLWFLIDTGAEATILNAPRLAEMGLTSFGATSTTGGGNSAGYAYADAARLTVGGVAVLDQRVGVMDLHGLEKIYGMPMAGLIGYDFISRFVMRVDYAHKTIDLYEPSGWVYRGAGAKLPFVIEEGHPHVPGTIAVSGAPPIAADMVVDSGAAGTVNLSTPFVKANNLLELAHTAPADRPTTMAGSEKEFFAQTLVRGRLDGFTLAGVTVRDVPTSLMVGTTGAYASGNFSGTIGQGLLHRFDTVYDYARRTIYLERNADFDAPFPVSKSFGITLLSDGADYTVFNVTAVGKGSPAEAAGFQKGDVIRAIDGTKAESLRLADVRRLLSEDGAHRRVEIRRGDETKTLEFTLERVPTEKS